jgi:hypothetical protein
LTSHVSTINRPIQEEKAWNRCKWNDSIWLLGHASYMIGSEGVAAIIDPQRDVDIYLRAVAPRSRVFHLEKSLELSAASQRARSAAKTRRCSF